MADPTRVRHLVKGLGPGGAERLIVSQVLASDPARFRHDVVHLLPDKDHLAAELSDRGVPVTCLQAGGTVSPGWVRRLRRVLRDEPADILHVHSPAVAAVARLVVRTLPRALRPALVSTEHNRWPRHRAPTRWANRLTIRLDDATIAVSHDVASTVRGIPAGRVRTVIHGIDLDAVRRAADRDAVRAELGAGPDDVLIVCVANLRREKALDVLASAAASAIAREPRLRYVVAGQGPLAEQLSAIVSELGLGDRFILLGYRDDAPRVISGADIFTLSSRHEGLPVAIMEALALGVPVVATAAGAIPEAIGPAGTIVPVDDVEGLADAHLDLAHDDDRRRLLAAHAARESARFDIARAVAEIEEIYVMVTSPSVDRPSSIS